MIKKAVSFFWSMRREFVKYFIVGLSGLFLDMSTLILLTEKFGMLPVVAVVINQIVLLTYNFLLNKFWSFKNKTISHKQLIRYLSLTGFNYIFSVLIMYEFNHILDFDYRMVRIGTIAIMVSWNFFLYKYWVYKAEKLLNVDFSDVNNFNSLNNNI